MASANKKNEMIKYRILVPLGLALVLLLVFSAASIYWQHRRYASEQVEKNIGAVEQVFKRELNDDAELLSGLIGLLEGDEYLRKAWLAKDKDALYDRALPIFENILSRYRVTHFYFIDSDRICFLRIHNPPKHGDYIDRFTMDQAVSTQKVVRGIELGKFGTFTLRVVHPWRIDGRLVGYLELGEEIEHITPKLKEMLDLDIVFFIDKTYLEREDWEEGLRMVGKTGDWNWDQFEDFVIIDKTLDRIPAEIAATLSRDHPRRVNTTFNIDSAGRRYSARLLDLRDVAGRQVGGIVAVKDVTRADALLQRLLVSLIAVSVFVSALLGISFYMYINRIEQKLAGAYETQRREIAERKETENKLREHRSHLEEKVAERTRDLEKSNELLQREIIERKKIEESLKMSNKKLERSNKEFRDLTHIASHDLREPLRKTASFGQLLEISLRDKLNSDDKENMKFMMVGINRMQKLVKALRDYSAVITERKRFRNVDLGVMVEKLRRFELANEIKKSDAEIQIQEPLPVVNCNPEQIRQVMRNLITNAVKYRRKGVRPEVIIRSQAQQAGMVRVEVCDNGIGIRQEQFKNIFVMFKRLHSHQVDDGAGIGLVVCKRIIEQHGGNMGVNSAAGRGSTFWFTIPAVKTVKEPVIPASKQE